MKSFGLTLINKLNKNSTNAKTQIDYCFANVNCWKCDYFESLTSFHKPLWIRKHEIDAQLHVDENEQIRTDMPLNLGELSIDDCSDVMDIDDQSSFEQTHTDISFNIKDFRIDDQPEITEIDEQSSFENFEMTDEENDQIHTDISFNLKELKTGGLRASTIFHEKSPIETYEIVDLTLSIPQHKMDKWIADNIDQEIEDGRAIRNNYNQSRRLSRMQTFNMNKHVASSREDHLSFEGLCTHMDDEPMDVNETSSVLSN
ncbi:unnamed protein product [Rotaria socialis]|uniref:Uncharacterized protein n=1 Tax=Rotaria socialis TaxID=392032 RepID=A0A820CYY7_9BILA|nr:unnamed protein product [Rotaria socialis]CAF4229009.1 unnamed protein product [Rotaria socialis]